MGGPKKDKACFYVRKMKPEDLEALFSLLSDPEVMRYLEPPFDHRQTEEFLQARGLTDCPSILAVDDDSHRFIGYVIYHDYDDESKEIGWVLKQEIWGKGTAGLLTEQLAAMAAAEGKDAVIECVPEHAATNAIAESHGFRKVGTAGGLWIYRRKRNR